VVRDDLALKSDFRHVDFSGTGVEAAFMMRHLGAGRPFVERASLGIGFLGDGRRAALSMLENRRGPRERRSRSPRGW